MQRRTFSCNGSPPGYGLLDSSVTSAGLIVRPISDKCNRIGMIPTHLLLDSLRPYLPLCPPEFRYSEGHPIFFESPTYQRPISTVDFLHDMKSCAEFTTLVGIVE